VTDEQILSAALRSAWAQTYVPLRDCVAAITDRDTQARVMALARTRGFVRERGLVDWAAVQAFNDAEGVRSDEQRRR
jgi:stage V sporulation protein SpoVS